jgi:hypothetical protein
MLKIMIYSLHINDVHMVRDGGRGVGRGHAPPPTFLKKKKFIRIKKKKEEKDT